MSGSKHVSKIDMRSMPPSECPFSGMSCVMCAERYNKNHYKYGYKYIAGEIQYICECELDEPPAAERRHEYNE